MIREAISQLLDGQSLSAGQAERVMDEVMTGEATPAQIAGFLIALRVKGETADEITGCARAMRRAAESRGLMPKNAQAIRGQLDRFARTVPVTDLRAALPAPPPVFIQADQQ